MSCTLFLKHGFSVGMTCCRVAVLAVVGLLCGCSGENDPLGLDGADLLVRSTTRGVETSGDREVVSITNPQPPSGLVSVEFGEESLTLWPYTGEGLDGSPSDPVNLVFVGHASPAEIRAALLALDGDRTAFGFPPAYPFNATWSDAAGGVHATYAEGEGWVGSVIQLQLGSYGPVRFHLRLFQTTKGFGSNGTWTVGGAHFEVLIQGTADHQVLSWERAEEIVVVDLLRSGLVDPSSLAQSGPINAAPSFREIPPVIYNGLPAEIRQYIGGPIENVTSPVPILTNGSATILNLAGAAPIVPTIVTETFTLTYQQIIPRPFCIEGPLDWVLVQGPVDFVKTVEIDDTGRYEYQAQFAGRLTVTPMDVTVNPPVPVGAPFAAEVSDVQEGFETSNASLVLSSVKRIAPQEGGAELLMTRLKVATIGLKSYRAQIRCLSDGS